MANLLSISTFLGDKEDEAEIVGLAKDACDERMEILREPEKSQAKHAIKVLCAFMSTTRTFAPRSLFSSFMLMHL